MFQFRLEWYDAPGVTDKILARTWALLEIRSGDPDSEKSWPSNLISRTGNAHRGIFGSVFPLAEWIVENWWFLLFEPCRVPELTSGRSLVKVPRQRPWVQRHCLLAAREGGALPDLSFYRDGRHVVAKWFPDPAQTGGDRPLFFTGGEHRFSLEAAQQLFHGFVEEVLARLDRENDDDTDRFRQNWRAVIESQRHEANSCAWAARLGLDPYAPDSLTDDLIDVFRSNVSSLGEDLRDDLLQASDASSLVSDLNWIQSASQVSEVDTSESAELSLARTVDSNHVPTAHGLGYQFAQQFRKGVDLAAEPIADLTGILADRFGWPSRPDVAFEGLHGTRFSAIVGNDRDRRPCVVGPQLRPTMQRFRLARAFYFHKLADSNSAPRLLTRAHSWDQRVSRAFAAELLAPADALREEIRDAVPRAKVDELARKFHVDSSVIEHQLQNHQIGWIEDF
jgi:hypothetical protein